MYPAIWEPIFDAETWERLQLVIRLRHDRNGYEQGPPKARKYLLTGVVYCGRCGWPLSGSRMYDTKDKTPCRVYFCSKRTDQLTPAGCNQHQPAEKVTKIRLSKRSDTPVIMPAAWNTDRRRSQAQA